jgi:copper chaperone CopZ
MRTLTLSLAGLAVLALSAASSSAEVSAKITDVHLCCKSCVTGVEKAIAEVPDAKATVDQENSTVTLTGPDAATVHKAAGALVKAGYFGKSADASHKLEAETGAQNKTVQTMKIEGVHLCCPKCVKAVDKAVKSVPGVKEQTATKGAKSFDVTGDFNEKDVMKALQEAGLTGKVAK